MAIQKFKNWARRLGEDEDGDIIVNMAWVIVGLGIIGFVLTVVWPKIQVKVNDALDPILRN